MPDCDIFCTLSELSDISKTFFFHFVTRAENRVQLFDTHFKGNTAPLTNFVTAYALVASKLSFVYKTFQ